MHGRNFCDEPLLLQPLNEQLKMTMSTILATMGIQFFIFSRRANSAGRYIWIQPSGCDNLVLVAWEVHGAFCSAEWSSGVIELKLRTELEKDVLFWSVPTRCRERIQIDFECDLSF